MWRGLSLIPSLSSKSFLDTSTLSSPTYCSFESSSSKMSAKCSHVGLECQRFDSQDLFDKLSRPISEVTEVQRIEATNRIVKPPGKTESQAFTSIPARNGVEATLASNGPLGYSTRKLRTSVPAFIATKMNWQSLHLLPANSFKTSAKRTQEREQSCGNCSKYFETNGKLGKNCGHLLLSPSRQPFTSDNLANRPSKRGQSAKHNFTFAAAPSSRPPPLVIFG